MAKGNKRLAATIVIGGAVSGTLTSSITKTKRALEGVGSAIEGLDKRQRLLGQAIQTFGRQGRNVDGMRERYAALTAQVERLRSAKQRLATLEQASQANLERRAKLRGQLFDALAIGATVAAPIRAAADFETAMLGVAKQVDGARDDAGNLTAVYHGMAREIQALAREVPMATNEIAEMVTAGARMGVARDELIGFTRTAAMMASAFEMPAGELADSMGKVAGLFKIPITQIGELADAINYLDDNAQSKGGEIIEVLQRIAGQADTLGMSAKDAAALGSTFLSLGASAEVAASGANAVMRELAVAAMQPKRFQAGLKAIGMDARRVQLDMARDTTGTILRVLDAINKLPSEKRLEVTTQLFGKEYGDDVAKLAGNVAEYRRQLQLANGEEAKGSMSREFEAQRKTAAAQYQLLKNRVGELAVTLGTVLLPPLNEVMGKVGPMVTAVATWARENPRLTTTLVGTATALGALKVGSIAAGYGFTFLKGAYLSAAKVMQRARLGALLGAAQAGGLTGAGAAGAGGIGAAATRSAAVAVPAFQAIGAAVAGVSVPVLALGAAIAGAALLVYKYWEPIKAFFVGVGQGIGEVVGPVFTEIGNNLSPLKPAFDAVAGAIGGVWQWLKTLAEPVKLTADGFETATNAGRTFGRVVGGVIRGLLAPIRALSGGVGWVAEKLGLGTAAAPPPRLRPIRPVNAAPAAPAPAAGPAAAPAGDGTTTPRIPRQATRGGTTVHDNRQYSIQITQQPGESQDALARRVAAELARQDAARRRGQLYDGVAG